MTMLLVVSLAVIAMLAVTAVPSWRLGRRLRDTGSDHAALSDEKFAARCRELATPADEPPPDLPAALPLELRDPAFQRRAQQLQQLEDRAWREAWRYAGGSILAASERLLSARAQRRELMAREPVTDRSFEPHTHCPAGHVGWHWIWDDELVDGVTVVHRSCWWITCPEAWAEPAYTQETT